LRGAIEPLVSPRRPGSFGDHGSWGRVREFFEQNETIILFSEGLVFFALGFAVWLQRRRATRFRLTSSLIWLAAFAFFQAFAVWGYVFVPIQRTTFDAEVIDGLVVIRALIQTVAFLFLFQFGLRLLHLSRRAMVGLTAASIALWALILFGGAFLAWPADWGVAEWERSVEAASRYLILLPAALLAAYGLWRQREDIGAAGLAGIRPYAGAAAATMALYGLVGGLVVDPAPWAPGGIGNQDDWLGAVGFQVAAVRGALGLALCVLAVKLLEIFEVEASQQLEALDRARLVAEERSRFSRDLHDGTIQSLYAAGLQLEAATIRIRDAEARAEVRRVVGGLNDVISGIRAYIRDLAEPALGADAIVAGLREQTERFQADTGRRVRFVATGVGTEGPLPEEAGQHLTQILREALSNAARHAGECRTSVELRLTPDEIELSVADDGRGMDMSSAERSGGQGMRNMRERARRLGGRLDVRSAPGGGARIVVSVPLDAEIDDPGGLLTSETEVPV
jgi:signal transduction histidine kinase